MRRSLHRRSRDESGVALIVVLVVLVLIVALSTEVAFSSRTYLELSQRSMHQYLLDSAVAGRRQILRRALAYDQIADDDNNRVDTEDEAWSWHNTETLSGWGERSAYANSSDDQEAGYTNLDVEIKAWCEDERSKLNLLGLSRAPGEKNDNSYTKEALIRLIDVYRDPWPDLDINESDATDMVDDLMEMLTSEADEDENPQSPAKPNRGRLQSVDDLLRVPGGKWTSEILYAVRDPELTEEELAGNDVARRSDDDEDEEYDDETGLDPSFGRVNGVPGLIQYLSVAAPVGSNAASPETLPLLKINLNTAPIPVLKALLDDADEELAAEMVAYRRQAVDTDETATTGGSEDEAGWFVNLPADLIKVDGFEDNAEEFANRYPRLAHFMARESDVFSLYVVATVVTGTSEGPDFDVEDEEGGGQSGEQLGFYQYREIVERTENGLRTLFVERRHDPVFDRN